MVDAEDSNREDFAKIITNGNYTLVDSTNKEEYLRWHYRLSHLSWKQLRLLAPLGIIQRKLANFQSPPCPCCIAANMSRLPTRTKGSNSVRNIQVTNRSGQYVSFDQLECLTPGFVAQLKGRLTRKRYRVVSIYVNHRSDPIPLSLIIRNRPRVLRL